MFFRAKQSDENSAFDPKKNHFIHLQYEKFLYRLASVVEVEHLTSGLLDWLH